MRYRYYVGKYESDVLHTDYFQGSITYLGSNKNNNLSFCTNNERFTSSNENAFMVFLQESMSRYINAHNKNVEFFFYNHTQAHDVIYATPEMESYIRYLNPPQTVETLNNKAYTRLWLSDIVSPPPFKLMSKEMCYYCEIVRYFPDYKRFVIQKNGTSGGKGTFLLNESNEVDIRKRLSSFNLYIVSPYIENSYSANIHVCITQKAPVIFPVSLQIIQLEQDALRYSGADYNAAKHILEDRRKEIYDSAEEIAYRVRSLGYRGVMGIDFIITKRGVMFIEINPRFQGSSLVVSKSLVRSEYMSLYQMHAESFSDTCLSNIATKSMVLDIPYSLIQCRNVKGRQHSLQLYDRLSSSGLCEIYADGYHTEMMIEPFGYLYRALLETHISCIGSDNTLNAVGCFFDSII